MGKLENSAFGMIKGRIGNLVSYQLKGKNVIRQIGKSIKPPTLKQLTVRQKLKVTVDFLKPILAFINIGFEHVVAGTDRHPYNEATSYNNKHALQGDYPYIQMDYSKALVSMGNLEPAINPQASLTGNELEFTWEESANMNWGIKNDRSMLMVYCAELNNAIYFFSAARRSEGRDKITLPNDYLDKPLHLYIAFKASNGKSVSNSVWITTL